MKKSFVTNTFGDDATFVNLTKLNTCHAGVNKVGDQQSYYRVPAAWKSHGKWFLFSGPGIVMEFVKKLQKSWIF